MWNADSMLSQLHDVKKGHDEKLKIETIDGEKVESNIQPESDIQPESNIKKLESTEEKENNEDQNDIDIQPKDIQLETTEENNEELKNMLQQ